MVPKIDLSKWDSDVVPKSEVEKMTNALSEAFAMMMHQKESEYRFAKIVSYISLSIALFLIFLEVIGK